MKLHCVHARKETVVLAGRRGSPCCSVGCILLQHLTPCAAGWDACTAVAQELCYEVSVHTEEDCTSGLLFLLAFPFGFCDQLFTPPPPPAWAFPDLYHLVPCDHHSLRNGPFLLRVLLFLLWNNWCLQLNTGLHFTKKMSVSTERNAE